MNKPDNYFLLFLFLPLLLSCGKDNVAVPTNKQALTANNTRTWRLVRKTLDGTAQFIPACLADDRLTFRLNETYSYNYGSSQCNADDPTDYTGDWRFNKAQDSLTFKAIINGRFTERKVKIGKLTAQELHLQYPSAASLMEETYY
jgi:hypothetical protein